MDKVEAIHHPGTDKQGHPESECQMRGCGNVSKYDQLSKLLDRAVTLAQELGADELAKDLDNLIEMHLGG